MPKSSKIRRETVIATVLLCGITGSAAQHPIAKLPASILASVDSPIITRIVSRHYTVVVAAGPTAAVYTVTGEHGEQLTEHITLAAMKLTHPDLFNHIAPALAMGNADAAIDTDSAIGD